MLLAEIEIWHSRPIAPTRRVALGRRLLPVDPAPGFGGLLLGGIVARHADSLDADLAEELVRLVRDLERDRRIPQPRLRHRFQADRTGLARSRHRLVGHGDRLDFELDDHGSPASQVLGATYAAGALDPGPRAAVMDTVLRAMRWRGPLGPALVAHLSGAVGSRAWSVSAFAHPEAWALGVLGLAGRGATDGGPAGPAPAAGASAGAGAGPDVGGGGSPGANGVAGPDRPDRAEVQRRFRELVRAAHPDHGGDREGAAKRIADLAEARRILLT